MTSGTILETMPARRSGATSPPLSGDVTAYASRDSRHSPQLGSGFAQALRQRSAPDDPQTVESWANALLTDAVRERASDIHLDSQQDEVRVRFRIDGTPHDVALLPTERG